MSKNISNLSGRIGLKKNLFEKISERSLNSKDSSGIKEIADEYHMGVSTIHGAESFYEFLRPAHRAKKAFVCNGSACMCSGTQEPLKKKLKEKLGDDKVGEMFCLGHCYENKAFHYDGENYAGNDIDKIDEIIKGEKIEQEKFFSKSFASTMAPSILGFPISVLLLSFKSNTLLNLIVSPFLTSSFSISNILLVETLYCFPPVSIIANDIKFFF